MEIKPTSADFDVIITGGGLAGLVSAILLGRRGKKILLIEKKSYPFHKVCGEYVSNEVLGFLESIGFHPFESGASRITRLRISTPSGKSVKTTLDMGGFGLSRFVMDASLYSMAVNAGVQTMQAKVSEISFREDHFRVKTSAGAALTSRLVIASYGKRDALDKKLDRDFIQSHTGYMGVKYHVKTVYPVDEIGLDNFEGGYCGIVKIEEDKFNICYLYKRNRHFSFNSVHELEEKILFKNPVIKNIFKGSEFLFSQPEVINEISFARKSPVENHVLMCGDAAGLITPLCGNGMSMAIHSSKILSELILESGILEGKVSLPERKELEEKYRQEWKRNFSRRLTAGRTIQKLFGNSRITGAFIRGIHAIPPLERWLISTTHGKEI